MQEQAERVRKSREHVAKAERHAEAFRRLTQADLSEFRVIAAFYVSLQLVSAVLALDGIYVSHHQRRAEAMTAHPRLKICRAEYNGLQMSAEQARYSPGLDEHPPRKRVDEIQQRYTRGPN